MYVVKGGYVWLLAWPENVELGIGDGFLEKEQAELWDGPKATAAVVHNMFTHLNKNKCLLSASIFSYV